jgi:hypothetical protein
MARQDPTRDTCLVVLLAGFGGLAVLGFLISEAVRWVA